VAPNLGDDSERHEDPGTTENTEITERKAWRNPKEGTMMEIGMDVCRGPARNSLHDLCVLCVLCG
jgi:hypothetical protein